MDETPRLRRNLLFVPGSRPDRFPKALAHRPDMVTVDLEDAVLPAQKDGARDLAMALFDDRDERADRIERVVRINPLRTPDGLRDLLALIEHPSPPDGVMLPRSSRPTRSASSTRCCSAPRGRSACT